ncbi:copper chaperone PCu(A)C [Streptomyces bohaiensis]|uniref:copper chaperone PCu(A)C n=1 Tax=Streptomyces bohaiensis TaxID=1431344 RepID=UPI003B807EF0
MTVSDGRVYRPILDDRQMTALFFTVTNEATAGDELIAVDAGEVGETMFSDHVHLSEGSGRMEMIDSITFAPEQTLAMTAFTQNIMVHLKRPLELGEELDFTLVFRQAGEVRASAVVVRHGE